jgi:hypothetical protein
MFGEKSIYEDAYNKGKDLKIKDPKIPSSSTLLRVVCLILTVALVFTIIKHYQFKFQLRKLENYGIYYSSIWKDP